MINDVNLAKMYDSYLVKGELKTKELKEIGFNYNDLNTLMNEKILEKVGWGVYEVISPNLLYDYGVELNAHGEDEKANLCFRNVLRLDGSFVPAILEVMINALKRGDYQEVVNWFYQLLKVDERYHRDITYYLYLLGISFDLPDLFRSYVKALTLEDIKVLEDDKVRNVQLENIIRNYAMKKQFGNALRLRENSMEKDGHSSVNERLERELLVRARDKEKNNMFKLNDLIKAKDYEQAYIFLSEKKEQDKLALSEEYMLKLLIKYLEIRKSLIVPEVKVFWSNNTFKAIDGNNFELAYNLAVSFQNKNGHKVNNLALILKDIIKLVKVITNIEKNMPISKEGFKLFLKRGEIERASDILSKYLKVIKREEYEFLVKSLIKISFLEGDLEYHKPLEFLDNLGQKEFSFNLGIFVRELYDVLLGGRIDIVSIYLDILKNSDKLGYNCNIALEIEMLLEQRAREFREQDKEVQVDLKL